MLIKLNLDGKILAENHLLLMLIKVDFFWQDVGQRYLGNGGAAYNASLRRLYCWKSDPWINFKNLNGSFSSLADEYFKVYLTSLCTMTNLQFFGDSVLTSVFAAKIRTNTGRTSISDCIFQKATIAPPQIDLRETARIFLQRINEKCDTCTHWDVKMFGQALHCRCNSVGDIAVWPEVIFRNWMTLFSRALQSISTGFHKSNLNRRQIFMLWKLHMKTEQAAWHGLSDKFWHPTPRNRYSFCVHKRRGRHVLVPTSSIKANHATLAQISSELGHQTITNAGGDY